MVRIRRSSTDRASASGAHVFVQPRDGRSALALGASQAGLQMGAPMAVADASAFERRCGLTGCGKALHDPIHWPEAEAD